ncbi:MAG: hypothetical protein Q9207_001965 [Kuettlingeria erythrocarpa]
MLNLQCNKVRIHPNKSWIESLAIPVIAAMRVEAVEIYTAAVHDYGFAGTLPPQARICIALRAIPSAATNLLKRSSVIWSIRALALELMRTMFFHPLLFTVKYHAGNLYGGVLSGPSRAAMPVGADNTDVALAPSSQHVPNVFRRDTKPAEDQTQYQIDFKFVGERPSQLQKFSALVAALLQPAPSDATSICIT